LLPAFYVGFYGMEGHARERGRLKNWGMTERGPSQIRFAGNGKKNAFKYKK